MFYFTFLLKSNNRNKIYSAHVCVFCDVRTNKLKCNEYLHLKTHSVKLGLLIMYTTINVFQQNMPLVHY